jgi:hypothetical protein
VLKNIENKQENKDSIEIKLDKDNKDILFEGEYSLLSEERTRRSNEQTEYLKFVLIGIIGQFGIFLLQFLTEENSIFDKINKVDLNIALLSVSAGVVVLTTILFLLWLDHALTISAIDKYFRKKEEQNDILGWYRFRENYSKSTFFRFIGLKINLMNLKIKIFRFAIFISFLISPALFVLISTVSSSLDEYKEVIKILIYSSFSIFAIILFLGLLVWSFSGRGIYFNDYVNKKLDKTKKS